MFEHDVTNWVVCWGIQCRLWRLEKKGLPHVSRVLSWLLCKLANFLCGISSLVYLNNRFLWYVTHFYGFFLVFFLLANCIWHCVVVYCVHRESVLLVCWWSCVIKCCNVNNGVPHINHLSLNVCYVNYCFHCDLWLAVQWISRSIDWLHNFVGTFVCVRFDTFSY